MCEKPRPCAIADSANVASLALPICEHVVHFSDLSQQIHCNTWSMRYSPQCSGLLASNTLECNRSDRSAFWSGQPCHHKPCHHTEGHEVSCTACGRSLQLHCAASLNKLFCLFVKVTLSSRQSARSHDSREENCIHCQMSTALTCWPTPPTKTGFSVFQVSYFKFWN